MKAALLFVSAVSAKSLIEFYGMTEVPQEPMESDFLQLEGEGGWNNKPWKEGGYEWDQGNLNKFYKVKDSHSYIEQYDVRKHAWSDKQFDQSDEVKFFDITKALNADYLENTLPGAEYHLRNGRTGVAAPEDFTTA